MNDWVYWTLLVYLLVTCGIAQLDALRNVPGPLRPRLVEIALWPLILAANLLAFLAGCLAALFSVPPGGPR